jgi:prepilin-type N-terminal cleavage/methylation domain-containing protein
MRGQRGFSLIELMIALVLMSLIISGITSLVLSAGRAQSSQARVSVAQGGVRAALEFLTRDILSASAGASAGKIYLGNGTLTQNGAATTTPMPIYVENSTSAADRLDLISINASVRLTVLVAYAGGGAITVDKTAGLAVGDTIQVCDLAQGVLLQVAGFGTDGTGNPTINVVAPTNAWPGGVAFAPGSYVFKSRMVSYGVTGATALLLYYPNGFANAATSPPEPLADGIEDFQVALGIDANGDGVLASVGSAADDDEWVFNIAGDTAPVAINGLKSVRVTLVARALTQEVGSRGQPPSDAEDHHISSPAIDGYPRRMVRSEVTVRNFNL